MRLEESVQRCSDKEIRIVVSVSNFPMRVTEIFICDSHHSVIYSVNGTISNNTLGDGRAEIACSACRGEAETGTRQEKIRH